MTGWARPLGWVVANVAAAVLVGMLGCAHADVALGVLIAAFAVAQTLSLLFLSRRFWLWLPVTLAGTAVAFYAALIGVSAAYQTRAFDTGLRFPDLHVELSGSTMQIVVGATAGWLVLAVAQSFVLWFARRRWSWSWIPSVVIGGVGLDPLGVATFGRGFSESATTTTFAGAPPCDPLAISGGPSLIIVGALWYGVLTLLALRSPLRVSAAAKLAG